MTKTKALSVPPIQATDSNGKQPEEDSYDIMELKIIQASLTELGKLPTELSYQVAKNLKIVGNIIHDSDEALAEARKAIFEKDEKGDLKKFVEVPGEELRPYVEGEKLGPGARTVYKFTDLEKNNEITRQYQDEQHIPRFHLIRPAKAEEVFAREKVPAELIVPLLDTVIKDF